MAHAPEGPPTAADLLDALLRGPADQAWDLDTLLTLWRWRRESDDRRPWTIEAYRRISHRLAKLGDPLLAYDVAEAGLECWPGDVRLRQIKGLALARAGDPAGAYLVLSGLYEELQRREDAAPHEREETIGLLARTEKDFALAATDPDRRDAHLRRARDLYAEGYRWTARTWTGINAAALARLLGEDDAARELAGRVRAQCLRELEGLKDPGSAAAYWPLATLGEAALILGQAAEAASWYGRAAELGRGHWGDLRSTRAQARLLAQRPGVARAAVDGWFRIPIVVVFAGHMVDRPDRPAPRFPDRLVPAVHEAIRRRLEGFDAIVAYSSAACGSDLLFLQAVLGRDPDGPAFGEAHVVLPYHRDQFREHSVAFLPGSDWGAHYDAVLRRAVVHQVAQHCVDGDVEYEYANRVLHGLALMQARRLDTPLLCLAVWDGQTGDGPGGTAGAIAGWQAAGHDVEVLDLAVLRDEGTARWRTLPGARGASPPAGPPAPLGEFAMEILAIFFADVVGFSKLTERQHQEYVTHFLGMVAQKLDRYEALKRNTWGDGLYFVFKSVRDAGNFALELRDHVVAFDWEARQLPKLGLRIALHAGPVFHCRDPVTGQPNCIGTHVSHAARIEPITPPNQVYASQAFAAIVASDGVREFRCRYVGKTPLAKGYGTYPTYHVAGDASGAAFQVDRRPPGGSPDGPLVLGTPGR